MVCDTPLAAVWRQADNFQPRRNGLEPTILLMHYTGMESADAALDVLCASSSNVSCHYLVDEDGTITQMVRESRRAWHAGQSFWDGETDINSCSIGIEIVNEGHAPCLKPYPDSQIRSVIELARDIIGRHDIPPHRVIGHSDVAPERKKDPGESFPWQKLHENGVGHWFAGPPPDEDLGLGPGDRGSRVAIAQQMLARYGYGVRTDGVFDDRTALVLMAFQRHFRQQRIDGRLDVSTSRTLEGLVATMPKTKRNK